MQDYKDFQGRTKSGKGGGGGPQLGRGPGATQAPGGVQGPRPAGGAGGQGSRQILAFER